MLEIKPQLVLFDQNFTPENKNFRLCYDRNVTKTSMIRDFIGIKLPEDRNRRRVLSIDSEERNIHLRVTDWKRFLAMATPDQVACVQAQVDEDAAKIQSCLAF